MKTTLEHLPAHKRYELGSITEGIVNMVNPQMVILFGSYSRGNWVEHLYMEEGINYEYKSDYDILVVTRKPKEMPYGLEKEVRRKIKRAERLQTPPHIIFHDIGFLNAELERGQYFFSEIVREGTMLYNTGEYELATPKDLSASERAEIANDYYNKWYESANIFYEDFEHNYSKGEKDPKYLPISIFILHQSTERYYMAIALVFTDYKPKTHDLVILNKEAIWADPRFKTVFPDQNEEEKRLFQVLVKAYIDSRYKLNYTVDIEDLRWLAKRVLLLKELTETICLEKIKRLGKIE